MKIQSTFRMNSISDSLQNLPTSTKNNNRIKRSNTFASSSQTEFNSQAAKFRRTHIQWAPRRESFSTEFKSISMTDMNQEHSIEDYQVVRSSSHPLLASEDDDDTGDVLGHTKNYISQGSQVILGELKLKKKKKSEHGKKSKSSPKRMKPAVVPSMPSSILSSTSNHRHTTSHPDLTTPMRASATITRNEESNGTKSIITVDTSKARSNLEVVRLCIRELGWKECSYNTTADSDIYWHSSSFHEGSNGFTFNSGRVNKFPGMNDLLRKVHLTRLLNYMRLLFPNEYNFYPKTWFLPEQSQQFKDDVRYIHQLDKKYNRSLTTFIVKPSDGSQGEGIYLLRDPSNIILTNRPHVIQEYIDRPLLINGLKFDLRIYVLILNLYPLEIYLYDEGLVRFATVDYKAPTSDNIHQTYMHLTNYSLNKRSAGYKHTTDEKQTDGSKRKLTVVWRQLSHLFGHEKIERTKSLITELINKTILAVVPELRVECEFEIPATKRPHLSCFQIVGFDIILTEQLKPILLEINANPSLRIDFDKENEAGKIVYQSSLIDEEIKKPLILETLKLALPKKKLSTIARHAQIQADDEVTAQYYEKIAQRRVEERIEKMKSARKTRFDIRLNPFFSRPSEGIAKEVGRQQQELQKIEQKRLQQVAPTHPILLAQMNEPISAYTQFNTPSFPQRQLKHSPQKTKKLRYFVDDDHEGGAPTKDTTNTETQKRSCLKSGSIRPVSTATDCSMVRSIQCMKLIYSSNHRSKYQPFLLLDQISQIYIQLVVILGSKSMTGGQFRNFANVCEIINETITAPSIDILYFQILKKWQQFVVRTTLTGLPFAAFIEAFFLLSQRKYPHSPSLLDSVNHLLSTCARHMNLPTSTPATSALVSFTHLHHHHHLRRGVRTAATHSSSLNIRPSASTLRSSTTTPHRAANNSTPSTELTASSTKSADDKTKLQSSKQTTKSVFPLFFDVI